MRGSDRERLASDKDQGQAAPTLSGTPKATGIHDGLRFDILEQTFPQPVVASRILVE